MDSGRTSERGGSGRTVKGYVQQRLFPDDDLESGDDSPSGVTWESIMEDIARILVVSKYDRYLRDRGLSGDSGEGSR